MAFSRFVLFVPLWFTCIWVCAPHGVSGQEAVGAAPNWVRVTAKAAWAPRDSCAEFVFKDRLWLLGGWHSSFEDPPRDVWSTADGVNWSRDMETASWKHGDLATSLAFNDRLWLIGGWFGGRLPHASASNTVWHSTDGKEWKATANSPRFSPRLGAAGAVFQGQMWLLGGVERYYDGTDRQLKNDVWRSADGENWEQVTMAAPWSGRAYHAAEAFAGKLWVFGGGNYQPGYAAHNDVWSSLDGKNWTRESEHAPWPPRIWFSSAVHRDRLWVLGGWSNEPAKNHGDVWHTADGKTWHQLKSADCWSPRHEHSTYVWRDKLWVAGGMSPPLNNDVWRLDLPEGWPEQE